MPKDAIAIKYSTDPQTTVESNISTGQPEACLPGELVLCAQNGSAKIITIDATGVGMLTTGILSNENKGSVTVSSYGEGPNSIVLNTNSVTEGKVANNSVTNEKIISPVLITKGGTGQSTESAALNALLPSQTGNGNKLLVTDGTNTSWVRASLNIDQLNDVDTSGATKLNDQVLKWDSSTLQWKQRERITTFSDELVTNKAPGREGQIGTGAEYFYVCQGTDKWARTALQEWNDGAIIRSPATPCIAFTYEPIVARTDFYYSNVSLLLHMNGASGSASYVDSSFTPVAISFVSGTTIQSSPSLFGGGSGYFDGSGDYIQIAPTSGLDLIGSNFTAEAWLYPTAYKASGMRIMSACGGAVAWNSTGGIHWLMQLDGSGRLVFQWWNGSAAAGFQTTATVPLSAWTHVAASLAGSNLYLAINGAVQSFIGIGSVVRPSAAPTFAVAAIYGDAGASGTAYQGYMDELRITKGVGRYTSNFTVPTTAFAELGYVRDPNFANISLLLHADGNNGDTFFKDYSPIGFNIENVNNATISTIQSKFGGSSLFLNGAGSYLSVPNNSAFQFGSTEDFTIEFWFYVESFNVSYPTILGNGNTSFSGGAGTYAWYIMVSGSPRKLRMGTNNSNPNISSSTTIDPQTWYHAVITRSGGGTCRMWINGVYQTNSAFAHSFNMSNNGLLIGRNGWDGTAGYFNGYIDDLRITKGVSRYPSNSSNIAIPTSAYPDSA